MEAKELVSGGTHVAIEWMPRWTDGRGEVNNGISSVYLYPAIVI